MAAAQLAAQQQMGLDSISEDEEVIVEGVSDMLPCKESVCPSSSGNSEATTASFSEKPIRPPMEEIVSISRTTSEQEQEQEVDHSRRRGEPANLPLDEEFDEALAVHSDDDDEEDCGGAIQPAPSRRSSTNPFNAPVTQREYIYAICVGVLLSFNAGYVNATCLTGLVGQTGRKVNAASNTGTITLAALALAKGDISEFGFLTSNTLSYLLGSFLAGIMTPNPRAFRIEPSYGPTFLLGAACLTLSSTLAAVEGNEKFIFHFASAAAGIQNGISSLYSSNLIRSTGFTGTTTDIGIFFGQFLRGNRKNTWKLVVMLFLLLAFWLGGLVALYAATTLVQFSLLVNAILFLVIGGCVVLFLIYELDVSLGAAVCGTGQWKRTFRQLQAPFMEESSSHNKDDTMNGEDHIDALFDQFDMDRSGTIDRKELHAALKQAGIKVSKRQSAQMVKRADMDGDGTISRPEFHNIVIACQDSTSRESVTSRTMASSAGD